MRREARVLLRGCFASLGQGSGRTSIAKVRATGRPRDRCDRCYSRDLMGVKNVTVGLVGPADAVSWRAAGGEREPDLPVEAYPSLSVAAKLIGVSPSTLSRRVDVVRVSAANQERIPAGEVVRLAAVYRRRRVSRVAAALVERAAAAGVEAQERVGAEVDRAMEGVPVLSAGAEVEAFIGEARRRLPEEFAAQIEAMLRSDVEPGRSTVGWSPEGG